MALIEFSSVWSILETETFIAQSEYSFSVGCVDDLTKSFQMLKKFKMINLKYTNIARKQNVYSNSNKYEYGSSLWVKPSIVIPENVDST